MAVSRVNQVIAKQREGPTRVKSYKKKLLTALWIIETVFGWGFFGAIAAAFYFLVRASFYGGPWWHFLLCMAGVFVLYHLTLAYKLQRERTAREPAPDAIPKPAIADPNG